MARSRTGCGCALAVMVVVLAAASMLAVKFALPYWKQKPPPPSGKEMKVIVLDVGQGDSILVISPSGTTMLVDAGDETKGKQVVEALKREGVDHLDYFVATHMHPDHIGGAPAVLGAFKVGTVLQNGFPPPEMEPEEAEQSSTGRMLNKALNKNAKPGSAKPPVKQSSIRRPRKPIVYPTVTAYNKFKDAAGQAGAKFEQASAGQKIDLGGGAIVNILGPIEPFFTREQMRDGGNEPNANSVVMRIVYGDFSMLLPGDAEVQTEQRLVAKDTTPSSLEVKILKVAHHGSKYATSDEFLQRLKPEVAIISDGEFNRYGHPSPLTLNRLKANGVTKLYRTDLNGEISITTNGKTYEIKPAKETKPNVVWTGRDGMKDDSSRSGFITYGDFGPPPKAKKQ